MKDYLRLLVTTFAACVGDAAIGFQGPPGLRVMALTSEPTPAGGRFTSFGEPVLNNASQLLFNASYTDDEGEQVGLFRTTTDGSIEPVAVRGDSLPSGEATYLGFGDADIDDSGRVAFTALTEARNRAIIGEPRGGLVEIARSGSPDDGLFSSVSATSINNVNGVTFLASTPDEMAVYRSFFGRRSAAAQSGEATPDGEATFVGFFRPSINDSSSVAFGATLDAASGDSTGLYLDRLRGPVVELLREGQPAPDGDGVFGAFQTFRNLSLNNQGQVAIVNSIVDSQLGARGRDAGVFLVDEQSLQEVARVNRPISEDDDRLFLSLDPPVLNDEGSVLFRAVIGDEPRGAVIQGVFIGDGRGVSPRVMQGDPAPGGGRFSRFGDISLNNAGGVAFTASTTEPTGSGVYYTDGLLEPQAVIRVGDLIDGVAVQSLRASLLAGDKRSGLNDAGQVAVTFRLEDGRSGLALYTPVPEPASVALAVVGAFALQRNRRRQTISH